MSTVLETLENAKYNLGKNCSVRNALGLDQLNNAIVLLGKGYDIYDDADELLEKFVYVEDVPEKE